MKVVEFVNVDYAVPLGRLLVMVNDLEQVEFLSDDDRALVMENEHGKMKVEEFLNDVDRSMVKVIDDAQPVVVVMLMAIELEKTMMVVEFLNVDDNVIENRLLVKVNDDDDEIENLSFVVDHRLVEVTKDFFEKYLWCHFPYASY